MKIIILAVTVKEKGVMHLYKKKKKRKKNEMMLESKGEVGKGTAVCYRSNISDNRK